MLIKNYGLFWKREFAFWGSQGAHSPAGSWDAGLPDDERVFSIFAISKEFMFFTIRISG